MAWNISTGMKLALLSAAPSVSVSLIASTISFGDGDGTGGLDTINDSGSGLGVFKVDDFILVIGGTNNNKLVKALSVAVGKIEVVAGAFATAATGTAVCLVKISSGSFAEIMKNSVAEARTGARPTTADHTESGTLLVTFTRNTAAFSAGNSANGLNVGGIDGTTLNKAIDPVTGVEEIWRGIGLNGGGTAGHIRWYTNAKTTGASTTAVRMDGTVGTLGADANMSPGVTVGDGVHSEITDVAFVVSGA